jgi:hypothetical protein
LDLEKTYGVKITIISQDSYVTTQYKIEKKWPFRLRLSGSSGSANYDGRTLYGLLSDQWSH